MDEKLGQVQVTMNLVIPVSVMESKESIAEYLNHMLEEDPEFFGGFGQENIEILSSDISGD